MSLLDRARRIAVWAFVPLLAVLFATPGAQARYAAIVIDAKTGRVLHAVNVCLSGPAPDREQLCRDLVTFMGRVLAIEEVGRG